MASTAGDTGPTARQIFIGEEDPCHGETHQAYHATQ